MTRIAWLIALAALAACGTDRKEQQTGAPQEEQAGKAEEAPGKEPDFVEVDHILIGVKGPRMPKGLAPEEAKTLAYDLLDQLRDGADWAALKKEHSLDKQPGKPPGGPYAMVNHGVPLDAGGPGAYKRGQMVAAFGDVGFKLEVGEIGIADYHPKPPAPGKRPPSPFGYHIIKRTK